MKIKSINIFLRKSIFGLMVAGTMAGFLSSCTDESIVTIVDAEGTEGYITFVGGDMVEIYNGNNNMASRAGLPKNPDEKIIRTLHVFFFDGRTKDEPEKCKLLASSDYTNFPAYKKIDNSSVLKIPVGENVTLFGSTEQDANVYMVAIANIQATDYPNDDDNKFFTEYSPEGKISNTGRSVNDAPYKIETLKNLYDWVYYPRIRMDENNSEDITRVPTTGMPMIGEKAVNLTRKPDEPYILNMEALMAKVVVDISLDPKQIDGDLPTLTITEYGIMNMPIAVPFKAHTGAYKSGEKKPETVEAYLANYDVTNEPLYHNDGTAGGNDRDCDVKLHEYTTTTGLPVTINKDSKAVKFIYYTYENINLPDYAAKRSPSSADDTEVDAFDNNLNPKYPKGIVTPADRQRWKSTIAHQKRASALILKGRYVTDQELTYNAQFTIYLGGDSIQDPTQAPNYKNFEVKRNHCYDNNIVIRGLDYVRNSSDEVYTFDGRVNVVYDNPLYLAIINERMVDAHATALPMDVWISNTEAATIEGNITFDIEDPDGANHWIRMESVSPEDMMKGREIKGDMQAYAPGTGERPYFTYDLVTNTLKNIGKTISVPADGGNRTRIYFYIDENVPTSNTQTNYGKRQATININYNVRLSDGTLDPRHRTLEIDQAALVKVFADDANHTTWMEYYEEYLEHYDPLDRHEQAGELYTGLHWGLDGVNVNHNNYDGEGSGQGTHQIYYKTNAFLMTQWAINRGTGSMRNVKLFNDNAPESAFHYCYGKNKRESNGDVHLYSNTKGWYMPGIRELENAITTYYGLFKEFRADEFYWSCAPCRHTTYSYDRNNNYARATKPIVNGNNITYVTSGVGITGNPDSGAKPRVGEGSYLRIRAFYRVD